MRPQFLESGEEARLIPVVSESNKEIRLLSPVLCALRLVPSYANDILGQMGLRLGKRTSVECFVEVVFKGVENKGNRPDGLVIVNTGRTEWRALVEAKHGKNTLDAEQVTRYLELAKKFGIDAVVTISNEFVASPKHSPVVLSSSLTKKVDLYHLSWSNIFTAVELLISGGDIKDPEQALVLHELYRFLSHSSAGVVGFTQMNPGWRDITKTLAANGSLWKTDPAVIATATDWMQEQRDLCLILSREIRTPVSLRLSRKHAESQDDWRENVAKELVESGLLTSEILVPDAAANIRLQVIIGARVFTASMTLDAPRDRKSTSARINWVLRQLTKTNDARIILRLHWPGSRQSKDFRLLDLRSNPDLIKAVDDGVVCNHIEVMLVNELAGRFSGSRTFIECIETAFKDFYEEVGQVLKQWQPPAPRTVNTDDIVEQNEEEKLKQIRQQSDSAPIEALENRT